MIKMPSDTPKTDSQFAETLAGGEREFSREQEDIALAAVTLRSGVLTERRLAEALRSADSAISFLARETRSSHATSDTQ